MKNLKIIILALVIVFVSNISNAQSSDHSDIETVNNKEISTISFGVRGNCNMCKTTIEKAAKSVDGVSSANWNIDNKYIQVTFDSRKTNHNAIETSIAKSGYDTENKNGLQSAYDALPGCCQYDRNMNMGKNPKLDASNKTDSSTTISINRIDKNKGCCGKGEKGKTCKMNKKQN